MLGGNYARFLGIDWSLEQTLGLEERWTGILTEKKIEPPPRPHHSC